MMRNIVTHPATKVVAAFLAVNLVAEAVMPTATFALSGGPSQPEVQSFEPIGTTQMVDPFSGDFTYNIPLIDVGGYPINLSYHSGVSMDQEASWVGLGWNLNPGVINRNMRSVPDDFNGEEVKREFNIKDDETFGGGISASLEIISFEGDGIIKAVDPSASFSLTVGMGLNFNNYRGWGFNFNMAPSVAAGKDNALSGFSAGLGLNASSESGLTVSPSVGYTLVTGKQDRDIWGSKVGLPFNTRQGVQALTIQASYDRQVPQAAKKAGKKKKKSESGEAVTESGDDAQFVADPPQKNDPSAHARQMEKKKAMQKVRMANGSGSISFNTPSYTPKLGLPLVNSNITFNLGAGSEAWGAFASGRLTGYHSVRSLYKDELQSPAYGYLYAENGQNNNRAMVDFSREGDGAFHPNTLFLPLAQSAYDVYSVAAQGAGGTYRAYRGNIGYTFDAEQTNSSGGPSELAVDLGFGGLAKTGVNFEAVASNSRSGKWVSDNPLEAALRYDGPQNGLDYENVYFKQSGEMTVETDPNYFERELGGTDPIRMRLEDRRADVQGTKTWERFENRYQASTDPIDPVGTTLKRSKRERRNEALEVLTAWEASKTGVIRQIQDYGNTHTMSSGGMYVPASTWGRAANNPIHHISEISAVRTDGMRYVYGIPAYNHVQHEVSFAVNGKDAACSEGLVSYSPGSDNTKDNSKGLDNYYDRTTLPPYAHSYLLTAILSSDYKDLQQDGPSPDDYGGYTKFNYTQAHGKGGSNQPYKWRTPIGAVGQANYNAGQKSLTGQNGDDKANYIYGEKDIWYMHSIETKTHVAEFIITEREDARGVQGENGGVSGAMNSFKLDQIRVYSRPDRVANGAAAIPIKTVHFTYDYSLCPQSANSQASTKGKLTLKEVYFTFGSTNKGQSHKYKFEYGQIWDPTNIEDPLLGPPVNPAYHMKGYDRWGNYKRVPANNCAISDPLTNGEYPYTDQWAMSTTYSGVSEADVSATAWNLTKIGLPSGGDIYIDYESDDYAFVQDKKAMSMLTLEGVSDNPEVSSPTDFKSVLWDDNSGPKSPYLFLKFRLPNEAEYLSLTEAERNLLFQNQYLLDENGSEMEYLYFKFLVDIEKKGGGSYEFVPGYAELKVANSEVKENSTGELFGVVEVTAAEIQDSGSNDDVHPVSQAAWNYALMHLPHLAYDKPTPNTAGFEEVLKAIATAFSSFEELLKGPNRIMRRRQQGYNFIPEKSFVRLYHPTGFKKGGGSRVKRILMSDGWASKMDQSYSHGDAYYGQEYDYTDRINGRVVSSGVASYEPMVGGDENPFKTPLYNDKRSFLKPDQRYMIEKPIGESLFPGASVGYSKVTTRGISGNAYTPLFTGYTEKTFYTARDFPVISRQTPVKAIRKRPNPILSFLNLKSQDYMTASQGFVVELNDMHGKPKGEAVYGEGYRISSVEHIYKTSGAKQLSNEFPAIATDGTVSDQLIGIDYDMTVDFREQTASTTSGGLNVNLDLIPVGWLPFPIPMILPSFSSDKTRFRSATVTKVIQRHGLLERTVAENYGGRVTTSNLAVDAETGEVMLTEVTNQYFDNTDPNAAVAAGINSKVYNFNYPVHWVYDRMGPAYKNVGALFDAATVNGNLGAYFVEGDQVLYGSTLNQRAFMLRDLSGQMLAFDYSGNTVTLTGSVKVIRSGRKNQQNASVGTVVSFENPIASGSLSWTNVPILQASAIEYKDDWKAMCQCGLDGAVPVYVFRYIAEGNYRAYKNWAYLTGRQQTLAANTNGATFNQVIDLRDDGQFTSFSPFWAYGAGPLWASNDQGWESPEELTIHSSDGKELESKNAIDVYSAATYGYSRLVPKAMSGNAEYREIGYDGFEDYDFDECVDDHFSFRNHRSNVSEEAAHTGRRSIRVLPNTPLELKKKIN